MLQRLECLSRPFCIVYESCFVHSLISGLVLILQKKQKQEAGAQKASNEAPLTVTDFIDTDGKSLVEVQQAPRPCILEALGSAASGAFIGALYGFGTSHTSLLQLCNSELYMHRVLMLS